MWETIVLCLIFGIMIIFSFSLGLYYGQKLTKNEIIEVPNINPVKAISNEIERHEDKKRQNEMDIILSNIDNYDGSGLGQRDIPM